MANYTIRNKTTGETKQVPAEELPQYGLQPKPKQDTQILPILANWLKGTRTGKYVTQDVPEYYAEGPQLEDWLKQPLEAYRQQFEQTAKLAPSALSAAGEIAPFLMYGTAAKNLPQATDLASWLKRVASGAKSFGGIEAVSGLTKEGTARERAISGVTEGTMGALAGGTLAGITGAGQVVKSKLGKGVGKSLNVRKNIGGARAEVIKNLGEQTKASGLKIKSVAKEFAVDEPTLAKFIEKDIGGVTDVMDLEKLATKVQRWGKLAHTKTQGLRATVKADYYKALYEAGVEELGRIAPQVVELTKKLGLTYSIPRSVMKTISTGTTLAAGIGLLKYLWPFK